MKKLYTVICFLVSLAANAQVPKLESLPGTQAVVYLDFDGHYVRNAAWNSGNAINCLPGSFSTAQMTEIFKRVSEDYSIFKLNITTDSTKYIAAPLTQRIRIILTPTSFFVPAGTGGISYMNSFIWGDDTPGFVFLDANATPKFAAEATSHEAGHSLGLAHQSIYSTDCAYSTYNSGQGSGEIGWAPIMGFSIDRTFSTWNNGVCSLDCGMLQNDIAIIDSKIVGGGLKADDVPDTYTAATPLSITATNISSKGYINNSTDIDVFKVTVAQQSRLYLQGLPPLNASGQSYGNVDIMLKLLNATGVVIRTYNYSDSLRATIDTTLAIGTYYIAVDGVGNVNVSSDYGSVGDYELKGTLTNAASLPIYNMQLSGRINNNAQHTISWAIEADEPLRTIELQYSADGVHFNRLMNPMEKNGNFSCKPFAPNTVYYRLQAWLRDGSSKMSSIISLQSTQDRKPAEVLNNQANDELLVGSTGAYRYEIYDLAGRIVNKGMLTNGLNRIPVAANRRGMYIFKTLNTTQTAAERFVKL
jgi:hypothetical protein